MDESINKQIGVIDFRSGVRLTLRQEQNKQGTYIVSINISGNTDSPDLKLKKNKKEEYKLLRKTVTVQHARHVVTSIYKCIYMAGVRSQSVSIANGDGHISIRRLLTPKKIAYYSIQIIKKDIDSAIRINCNIEQLELLAKYFASSMKRYTVIPTPFLIENRDRTREEGKGTITFQDGIIKILNVDPYFTGAFDDKALEIIKESCRRTLMGSDKKDEIQYGRNGGIGFGCAVVKLRVENRNGHVRHKTIIMHLPKEIAYLYTLILS